MSHPSAIAKLLAGLQHLTTDPGNAGTTGLAQGLLAASAPHMLTPVSMGQAMGMGMQNSQAYQQEALKNALMRSATLPFQQARTQEFQRALQSHQPGDQAIAMQFAGVDPTKVPSTAQAITAAKNAVTPFNQGPQTATTSALSAATGGLPNVRGPVPTGAVQSPQSGQIGMAPGAIPAMGAADYLRHAIGARFTAGQPIVNDKTGTSSFAPLSSEVGSPNNLSSIIAQTQALANGQGAPSILQGASPKPAAPAASGASTAPSKGPTVGLGPSLTAGMTTTQKQATEQLSADITAGQEAQQRVANLEELNAVAGKLQTGPGMESRVAVERALASIPGAIGQQAGKLSTITNAQIFNKTALNLSLQTVSSAGQHAYDAFKSVMNAFPELSKTPLANSVVTASLLATARYQADRGKFAGNWQQSNNGMGFVPGKGTAEASWTKQAPFMAYFMNALPPEAQAMLVKKAQSNMTLRTELQQAAKGQRWLSANGY